MLSPCGSMATPFPEKTTQRGNDSSRGPTHFLALKITDPCLKSSIANFLDKTERQHPRYRKAFTPQGKLHISLACLHLSDQTEIVQAVDEFWKLKDLLTVRHNPADICLKIAGTSSFGERTLYADVKEEGTVQRSRQSFLNMVRTLRRLMSNAGVKVTDIGRPFVPHVTLIKLTRGFVETSGIAELDPRILELDKNKVFGMQQVQDICLMKMGGAGDEYLVEASMCFR